ncbi:MAG: hypothetical protein Q8L15_06220 [Methylobacter sp.]|nr:hypothetical protein [Methylobacter sp.]
MITMMMYCVFSTAYADSMDHFFESGSAWMDGIRSGKANELPKDSQSSQSYSGSLGKIEGGKVYDGNNTYKGHVDGGNVYDQYNRLVVHEGPSPFSFEDAVNHVIKH